MSGDPFEWWEMKHRQLDACPGYKELREFGDIAPYYKFAQEPCPELSHRAGHCPGGGLSYPEHWDKDCPTCHNTVQVIHHWERNADCPFCYPEVYDEMTKEM